MTTAAAISESIDVAAVFAALDRKDAAAFGAFLTPGAHYFQGNQDPVIGRDDIVSGTDQFLSTLDSIRHDLDQIWHVEDGFIVQGATVFGLPDGRTISLPCSVISRVANGLITEHRVYIDTSPLAC
jgi:limonene-1,2-epoxide hydrolase